MMKHIGADLSPAMEESLRLKAEYGLEWLSEVIKARREFHHCRLVHPTNLPTQAQLERVHGELDRMLLQTFFVRRR